MISHLVTVPAPLGSWIPVIFYKTGDFPVDWQPTEKILIIISPISKKWERILSKQSKTGQIDSSYWLFIINIYY